MHVASFLFLAGRKTTSVVIMFCVAGLSLICTPLPHPGGSVLCRRVADDMLLVDREVYLSPAIVVFVSLRGMAHIVCVGMAFAKFEKNIRVMHPRAMGVGVIHLASA